MQLSIIIPTYNEAKGIQQLIHHLNNNKTNNISSEIIIVDGGSIDNTLTAVKKEKVCLLKSPIKGRAAQMNYGAKNAKGAILYFLHADSYPPNGFDKQILDATEKNKNAGCFRMKFDSSSNFLKFWAWFTRLDWNISRGGDQSMFITKKLFNKIGCFDDKMIILEDTEIVSRIKKETSFYVIPDYIVTSARRYKKEGIYRLQFLFGIIHIMHSLGFSHDKKYAFYKRFIS